MHNLAILLFYSVKHCNYYFLYVICVCVCGGGERNLFLLLFINLSLLLLSDIISNFIMFVLGFITFDFFLYDLLKLGCQLRKIVIFFFSGHYVM